MVQGFWVGAEKNPDRVALIEPDGTRVTAGELAESVNQLIHGLRARGVTVGDVGELDSEGYLFLRDREIDMIISGGVNIDPAEVEAALLAHSDVGDAAVFGIPHDDWGEKVKAVIEPSARATDLDSLAERLIAHCGEKLAKYKCPRSIDVVDALPRDPNGKLYKRKRRDPYWSDQDRSI